MRDDPLTWTSRPGSGAGVLVMELNGPLTLGNIFGIQRALADVTDPVTIVDMSRVPYMDSAGLGVLMNFYVLTDKSGRKMMLAGANERVCALLEMTRVQGVLGVRDTVEAAEAALR